MNEQEIKRLGALRELVRAARGVIALDRADLAERLFYRSSRADLFTEAVITAVL